MQSGAGEYLRKKSQKYFEFMNSGEPIDRVSAESTFKDFYAFHGKELKNVYWVTDPRNLSDEILDFKKNSNYAYYNASALMDHMGLQNWEKRIIYPEVAFREIRQIAYELSRSPNILYIRFAQKGRRLSCISNYIDPILEYELYQKVNEKCSYIFAGRAAKAEKARMDQLFEITKRIMVSSLGMELYTDGVIAYDRPRHVSVDAMESMHNETGPAIQFQDGSKMYFINNVEVSEDVVEHPETVTIEQIDATSRLDIKNFLIKQFGVDRYAVIRDARKAQKEPERRQEHESKTMDEVRDELLLAIAKKTLGVESDAGVNLREKVHQFEYRMQGGQQNGKA